MKKHGISRFLTGVLVGALLFGAVPVIAESVVAKLSTQPVTVDGKPVQVTAYNINGSNYFKIRDLAALLDVGVWFDTAANTVRIEPDKKYDPNYNGPGVEVKPEVKPDVKPEAVIKITDYYNQDGKFSALGAALPADSKSGDKVLTVKNGDIIIVGDKQYKVTADSLAFELYTQPSIDKVIVWWTDYMNDWKDSGKIVVN